MKQFLYSAGRFFEEYIGWKITISICISIIVCGFIFSPLSKPTKSVAENSSPVLSTPAEILSDEQTLSALERGFKNLGTKACLSKVQDNSALVLFDAFKNNGGEEFESGWYLVRKIRYFSAGNGTYFIGAQSTGNMELVYPDISDLQCKDFVK